MNLNENIKLYREKNKITKSELARLINVSPSYITKLENGEKQNPSLEILMKIAKALNVELSDLDSNNVLVDYGNISTSINKSETLNASHSDIINILELLLKEKSELMINSERIDNLAYDKGVINGLKLAISVLKRV